ITTLTNLPAITNNWLTAAGIAANALNGKGDWLLSTGYTAPLDAAGTRTAIGLATANLDTQLAAIASYIDTEVAAILAAFDTEVAAIKAKTDRLTFDVAGYVSANIKYVKDTAVAGAGTSGSPWGP